MYGPVCWRGDAKEERLCKDTANVWSGLDDSDVFVYLGDGCRGRLGVGVTHVLGVCCRVYPSRMR